MIQIPCVRHPAEGRSCPSETKILAPSPPSSRIEGRAFALSSQAVPLSVTSSVSVAGGWSHRVAHASADGGSRARCGAVQPMPDGSDTWTEMKPAPPRPKNLVSAMGRRWIHASAGTISVRQITRSISDLRDLWPIWLGNWSTFPRMPYPA